MSKLAVLFFAAVPVSAATLQCSLVDWDSGRALARSLVTLETTQDAIQNSPGGARISLTTDRAGVAAFTALPDGAYIVTASRAAFATQQYGQKAWNRPGAPLLLQGDRPFAIQIRLRRLPSISGSILDENRVGIPGAPVVVYTAASPVKIAARGVTDDRGIYRVPEILPGRYFVRNAAKQFDDGLSVLPTFYPGSGAISDAHPVYVELDRSPMDVDFQPAQGRLIRLSGRVSNNNRSSGSVDLISDTGRVSTGFDETGSFSFESVAPGTYEIFTQAARYAGWIRIVADRDIADIRVDLIQPFPARFTVSEREGNPVDAAAVKLFARRKDLDGDGPVIPLISGRTVLAPGNWEVAASTAPALYPAAVYAAAQPVSVTPSSRADGWNPVAMGRGTEFLRVVVSSHPGSLRGRVVSSLSQGAGAVPVFLETLDVDTAEPPQVRTARTDSNGNYLFTGLPPGRYNVVSSYDLDPTNHASIEAARPHVVSVRENGNETQDLELTSQP